MDLVDYLRVLRRRWRTVAATVALAMLAAWLTTPDETATRRTAPVGTTYRATHTLLQAPDAQTAVNLGLTRLFAVRGEVPRRVAERLGEPPERGPVLAAQVQVELDSEVGSLAVTATGSDGERAAVLANGFATEIVENLRSTLQRDRDAERAETSALVESLGARISDLEAQIRENPDGASLLQAQRNAFVTNYSSAFARLQSLTEQGAARSPLVTLEEAVPVPVVTSSPFTPPSSAGGRTTLAALLGLLLGVVLALVLASLDRRLRSREAVEDITSLPVVAEVPVVPRKARRDWSVQVVTAPGGAVAEAYRSLRSAVMLVPSRPALQAPGKELEWRTPEVLLVASALPGDGKTTTVVNLAACLAESGRQVLVLDCDFRNPTLHRYLGVQQGRGMSDLLTGATGTALADVVHQSAVPGVRIVTSGTATDHPAALLARAGSLLDDARMLADIVLVDAAPVLVANDAIDLVPSVDGVVLVVRSGRTTREQALRTTELLARLAVPVAGTVLVASDGAVSRYSLRGAGWLAPLGVRRRNPSTGRPGRAFRGRSRSRARHTASTGRSGPPAGPLVSGPQDSAPLAAAPARTAVAHGTGWPADDGWHLVEQSVGRRAVDPGDISLAPGAEAPPQRVPTSQEES